MDKTFGAKKLYASKFPADIICSGHFHQPAVSIDRHYEDARKLGFDFGGKRIMVSLGTYLTNDSHSKRYWSAGCIGAPTVLFWPGEHRTEIFDSAESALIYREGMRHWKVSK